MNSLLVEAPPVLQIPSVLDIVLDKLFFLILPKIISIIMYFTRV